MDQATKRKIAALKREARKHYLAYHAEADQYNCGNALAEYMNPRIAHHRRLFNDVMAELEQLDKTAPRGFRL